MAKLKSGDSAHIVVSEVLIAEAGVAIAHIDKPRAKITAILLIGFR